jgi:hypothetical protein
LGVWGQEIGNINHQNRVVLSETEKVNPLISYIYAYQTSKVYASYVDGTLQAIDLKNNTVHTILIGKILYSLALSPDETKLIAAIKGGGGVIIDLLNNNEQTCFATDIWINKLLLSNDKHQIFGLQNIKETGQKKIVMWNSTDLDKPKYSIDFNGTIENITIQENTLVALIAKNTLPKFEQIGYFDIKTGQIQKFVDINCSFEKMIDSKFYKFTNEIKQCDHGYLYAKYLIENEFYEKGIISFQTGDLSRNPKRTYGILPTINQISSVSAYTFFGKHNDYFALFDTFRKQSVYFYMFMNHEWLMLDNSGYFKASSESAIAKLSVKIDKNLTRALTHDEIKYYHRPEIIDNQIKTSIAGENK